MKAYDKVNKVELQTSYDHLVELMLQNRQVELALKQKVTDGDGYLTWDCEYWSAVDAKRFVRYFSLEGRMLHEFTSHNIYDIKTEFAPAAAKEIFIG